MPSGKIDGSLYEISVRVPPACLLSTLLHAAYRTAAESCDADLRRIAFARARKCKRPRRQSGPSASTIGTSALGGATLGVSVAMFPPLSVPERRSDLDSDGGHYCDRPTDGRGLLPRQPRVVPC